MKKRVGCSRLETEEQYEEFIGYDAEDDNPFEKLRQQNIKRNQQIFLELDIAAAKAQVSEATIKKKINSTSKRELKKVLPLKEKSTRTKTLPQRYTSEIGDSISSTHPSKAEEIVECTGCGDMKQLSSVGQMKHGMCAKCWDMKTCVVCLLPSNAIPQVLICVSCMEIQHRICGKISKAMYKKLRTKKFTCKNCRGSKQSVSLDIFRRDILKDDVNIIPERLDRGSPVCTEVPPLLSDINANIVINIKKPDIYIPNCPESPPKFLLDDIMDESLDIVLEDLDTDSVNYAKVRTELPLTDIMREDLSVGLENIDFKRMNFTEIIEVETGRTFIKKTHTGTKRRHGQF